MSDDVLGAGTGAGVTGPTFRPEPAAFVPGAQWVNLVSGSLSVSAAIAVPNASFLAPGVANDGITGPQDGAVVFLAGTQTTHDGGQRILIWESTSTAIADGVSIFNPWLVTGTPGRWVRIGGGASVVVPRSAGTFLANNVITPIVAFTTGPGSLDLYGTAYFAASSVGIITTLSAILTQDISTLNLDSGGLGVTRMSFGAGGGALRQAIPVGPFNIVSAVPTVVQLYVQAEFSGGTVVGYGNIFARRPL